MISVSYICISILWIIVPYALGTPTPSPKPEPLPAPAPLPGWTETLTGDNSYTGAGGNAVGGSVVSSSAKKSGVVDVITGGKALVSAFSGNAGSGGDASSGVAMAHGVVGSLPGGNYMGKGSLKKVPGAKGSTNRMFRSKTGTGGGVTSNSNMGNAYSGAGGNTAGGSIESPGALLDIFSHNAGQGGKAVSGPSSVIRRKNMNKNRFDTFDNVNESRAISLFISPDTAKDMVARRTSRVYRSTYQ